jgi:hypothetical protein
MSWPTFASEPPDRNWPDELARRRQLSLADVRAAWFISAEDLILHKMNFYREGGSDKHLRDIASIVKISGAAIDSVYIATWPERLGLIEIWRVILATVNT